MAAGSQVEWIAGFDRNYYFAGLMAVLLAAYSAGMSVAEALGIGPQFAWSAIDLLLTIAAMAAFSVPAFVAYSLLVPTPVTLGVTPQGLLVELGPFWRRYGRGYAWADLSLKGRSLQLPRTLPKAPRTLRLSTAQRDRVAPRLPYY